MEFIARNSSYLVDWATALFVVALLLVSINKALFGNQFKDFIQLPFSDRYLNIYKDVSNIRSAFTISMMLVQFIVFSFVLHLFLTAFFNVELHNWVHYIRSANGLITFVLIRYLLEKIFSYFFHRNDFMEEYNYTKLTFRNYLGLILFPLVTYLFYTHKVEKNIVLGLLSFVILYNIFFYIFIVKKYKREITNNLLYFILYLCSFEIAPYFLIYQWVTT